MQKNLKNFPSQYKTNEVFFYDFPLYVDERVLIPRPETELLCEKTIDLVKNSFKNKQEIEILDIGTGSGAIALTLAKQIQNSNVIGIDISLSALCAAIKNRNLNKIKNVLFLKSDLFSCVYKKFDIIISNPPYVLSKEMKTLPKNVLFEPKIALDGGEDGLDYYRKIISRAYQYLNSNGFLIFEIHENKGREVIALLEKYGFKDISLQKDYCDKDRFVLCRKF